MSHRGDVPPRHRTAPRAWHEGCATGGGADAGRCQQAARGALAAAGARGRGYAAAAAEDAAVGHAEASSDRVGAGMRGDGTAPRFYKVVDVVRRGGGGEPSSRA